MSEMKEPGLRDFILGRTYDEEFDRGLAKKFVASTEQHIIKPRHDMQAIVNRINVGIRLVAEDRARIAEYICEEFIRRYPKIHREYPFKAK